MAQPVFSILTSAYRTEAYLPETIESVCAQTLQEWELIVIDNGMSDEVVRIVESTPTTRASGWCVKRTAASAAGSTRRPPWHAGATTRCSTATTC